MFTSSDVAKLVCAARVKPKHDKDDQGRTLTDRLTESENSFLGNWHWQHKPSPSKIVKRLHAINSAANQLLAKLPQSGDQSEAEVRYRLTAQAAVKVSTPELTNLATGSERLRVAIDAVKDIAAWSRAAMLRETTKKGRRPGHQFDVSMEQLIGDLNGVWFDFWERFPGASLNYRPGASRNDPGGPYIRFVQAFLQCVKARRSDEDLQADPDLRDALCAKPSAIRELLRASCRRRRRKLKLKDGGKSGRQET